MKTLNQLIHDYTYSLQQGELQTAYKGILEFIGNLRADFSRKCTDYDTGGIYQGYMDMSYFSISTKALKDNGLKIAIVYLHEKGGFEVWLSARNRETSKRYAFLFDRALENGLAVFHDEINQDSIIEYTLTSEPDFDNQPSLSDIIEQGTEKFIAAVTSLL